MFRIRYSGGVAADLAALCSSERSRLLDRIEAQLRDQPTRVARNRKPLPGLVPPWDHVPPIWELRVGDLRVFYDVDEPALIVIVRAIRRKPPHRTTGEIL